MKPAGKSKILELIIILIIYTCLYASIQSLKCPPVLDAFHSSRLGPIYVLFAALITGSIVVRMVFLILSITKLFAKNSRAASRFFLVILFAFLVAPIIISILIFPAACRFF